MEDFIKYRENRTVLNEQEDIEFSKDEIEEEPLPVEVDPEELPVKIKSASKGSTVPITPHSIDSEIISILTERIKDEYKAHYLYRAARDWCKDKGYNKAAEYFDKESKDELEHAKMVRDYLVDWNVFPKVDNAQTDFEFCCLVDVINQAYELEYNLFKSYMDNSREIFAICLATFDFLKALRDIQTSSVAEYSDLLNAVKLVDFNNKLDVLYFENEYFS